MPTYTWNQTSGNNDWELDANWIRTGGGTGYPTNQNDIAIFSLAATSDQIISVASSLSIKYIQVDSSYGSFALKITGATLVVFDNNGISNSTSGLFTLENPITMVAGISGSTVLFTTASGSTSIYSGIISGNNAINFTGGGTTYLLANNSQLGSTVSLGTTVQVGGYLTAGSSGSLSASLTSNTINGSLNWFYSSFYTDTRFYTSNNANFNNIGSTPVILSSALGGADANFGLNSNTGNFVLTAVGTISGTFTVFKNKLSVNNSHIGITKVITSANAELETGPSGFPFVSTSALIVENSGIYTVNINSNTQLATTIKTNGGTISHNTTTAGITLTYTTPIVDLTTPVGLKVGGNGNIVSAANNTFGGTLEIIDVVTFYVIGSNAYTGTTSITLGTLNITTILAVTGSISSTANIILSNGGKFQHSTGYAITYPMNIVNGSGTDGGVLFSYGNVTLTGNNTYNGLTNVTGGVTCTLGDGTTAGTISGLSTIKLEGTSTFVIDRNTDQNLINPVDSINGILSFTGTQTISGNITGNVLQKNNTGTLIMTGTLSVSTVVLNTGIMQLGNGGLLGSLTTIDFIIGALTTFKINRATLTNFTTSTKFASSTSNNSIEINSSGLGSIVFTGNSNNYFGTVLINSGTLEIATGGSLLSANITNSSSLAITTTSAITFAGVISGSGTLWKNNFGLVYLTNNNTYTGATNIADGTISLGNNTVNGDIANTSSISCTGTLEINRSSGTVTFNVPIDYPGAGSFGSLVLSRGTVILAAANTFKNSITIYSGVLQLGTGSTNGSIDPSPIIYLTGTFGVGTFLINRSTDIGLMNEFRLSANGGAISCSNTQTLNGNVNNNITSGPLIKNGTGTLALNGSANAHAGLTTINAGTLMLDTNCNFISSVANIVNNSAFVFNSNNTITVNSIVGTSGTITKNLSSTMQFAATSSSSAASFTINGGSIRFISGAQLAGSPPFVNNGQIQLENTTNIAGNVSGTGSVTKSTLGIAYLGGNNSYSGTTTVTDGELLIYGSSGTSYGTSAYVLSNTTSILTFSKTTDFVVSQIISGPGKLQVNNTGSGKTTLTNTNTYTGTTSMSAGTLEIGNGGAVGSIVPSSVFTITNNGRLTVNRNTDINFANTISGVVMILSSAATTQSFTGQITCTSLSKDGSGVVILTNSLNTILAQLTVSQGVLQVGNGGPSVTFVPNSISISSGSIYRISSTASVALNTSMSGAGTFEITSGSAVTIDQDILLTGTITIVSGSLQIGTGNNAGDLSGVTTINLNNNPLSVSRTVSYVINANISGTGGSLSLGTTTLNTMTLTGTNTYTGPTTIGGGTLIVGNGTTSGILSSLSTITISSGAGLSINRNSDIALGCPIIVNGSNIILPNVAQTLSGVISGTSIAKSGANKLTLTADCTFTGTLTISSGDVQIGNAGSIGSINSVTTVNIALSSTLRISRTGSMTITGTIIGAGNISNDSTGALILTNTNTYTGSTTISNGTLQIGNVTTTGSIDNTSNIVNNGELVIARLGNITISSQMTGTGKLSNISSGTLTIIGTHTYTGLTTVSAGTMIVGVTGFPPGNINKSLTTVTNATVKGIGTYGIVVLKSGGKIRAGNSIGILTVTNKLEFQSGSALDWEIDCNDNLDGSYGFGYSGITIVPDGDTGALLITGPGTGVIAPVLNVHLVNPNVNLANTFWDRGGELSTTVSWNVIRPAGLGNSFALEATNNGGSVSYTGGDVIYKPAYGYFSTSRGTDESISPKMIDGLIVTWNWLSGTCIHPDMNVITKNGEKKVKDLIVGDEVLTDDKENYAAITEIVHNIYKCKEFVKFKKNSIGENVPDSDLLLTPGHKLFMNDKLIKAKDAVNTLTVKYHRKKANTYSIVTKNGDLILVNNTPVHTWTQNEWDSKWKTGSKQLYRKT